MRKVMTPEFRASFANVFQPHAFPGQEPKYSIVMLFPKSTDLTELKKLAQEAVEEKWPDIAKRPANLRNPFRDGDVEKPDMDGYRGQTFVTASSKMKPGVVDSELVPIIDVNDFYSGCYARATVVAYAYDRAGNQGVSLGLQNVQKIRDGEPFSGRSKPEDDFTPLGIATSAPQASTGASMFD